MTTRLAAFVLLLAPLAGPVSISMPPSAAQGPRHFPAPATPSPRFADQFKQFKTLFLAGNFADACRVAEQGHGEALRTRDIRAQETFLGNLANCRFAQNRYREALQAYTQTRDLAEAAGDLNVVGRTDLNISSLYSQIGQTDAATDSAAHAMARLTGADRARQLPKLLTHLATLRAQQGRLSEAIPLFHQGIAAADRTGDRELYALGWQNLGEALLQGGRRQPAEEALLEAYRIRKLNRSRSIESTYGYLGVLRTQQGDLAAAAGLLDSAVERSKQPGGMRPNWEVFGARGRVRLAGGRLEAALGDLRVAAYFAGTWRRAVPLSDAARVSAENSIQETYAALVETANRLYFANHDPALAREAFEAAEANRGVSMRALEAEPRNWRQNLPDEYWATLRKLEAAEADSLLPNGDAHAAAEHIQQLRGELVQWESRAGSDIDTEVPNLLGRLRASLDGETAYVSFHLGATESYVWAVSRGRFEVHRLPPAAEILDLAGRFTGAVQHENSQTNPIGRQLYRLLFGQLDPATERKPHWLMALDSRLFELPLAALDVATADSAPLFLVERHSIQVVSGAGAIVLAGPAHRRPASRLFVGVADPVYNLADPRAPAALKPPDQPWFASLLNMFAARASVVEASGDPLLARLPGSARETVSCAAAWDGSPGAILLSGPAACRSRLQAAIGSHPAILHFATHILHPRSGPQSGLIVLSLTERGQSEILSPAEIATWHLDHALVSLSGCSSGVADVLPATGLMGLTRAWQAAGANAVVASLWPSPDDSGALFLSLYRHLREAPSAGPAVALQQAQVDMLRSNSWRSLPRYWGAYFITGDRQ